MKIEYLGRTSYKIKPKWFSLNIYLLINNNYCAIIYFTYSATYKLIKMSKFSDEYTIDIIKDIYDGYKVDVPDPLFNQYMNVEEENPPIFLYYQQYIRERNLNLILNQ